MGKHTLIEQLKLLEKWAREAGHEEIANDSQRLQRSLAANSAEPPDIPVGN